MSTECSLAIVQPLEITDAMLTSTTVAETDYAAYEAGTTYATGNRCIRTSTHKVYESLQDANTGHTPESSPTWWIEVSPTNRWKAFDQSNSTQTAQATSIVYEITPGVAISTVGVLNITNGSALTIKMTDGVAGVVYDKTVSLDGSLSDAGWWAWFFGARRGVRQYIALDLPVQMPNAVIKITLTGGSDLAVGVILLGDQLRYGLGVRLGARVGIKDYSRKETNDFGDTILMRRAYAKRGSFTLMLDNEELDVLNDALADLRAVPCLWIPSDRYDATMIYGFYRSFEIMIAYSNYSECELELEGLT